MEERKKVLVIDDEVKILEVVSAYLETKNFLVLTAETGKDGLELFEKEEISFIILDLMLPDLSGEEVCQMIRKKSRVPIIMLTAKTQEEDMLEGFSLGADDYVMKPFSLKELYARMEAIMRRMGDNKALSHRFHWNGGDLSVDFETSIVRKQGKLVSMTPKEWKILVSLISFPQKIFTREELITIAFGDDFDGYDRVIDTHVKNLRIKIEDNPKEPVYIKTIHGRGYQFGGEKG